MGIGMLLFDEGGSGVTLGAPLDPADGLGDGVVEAEAEDGVLGPLGWGDPEGDELGAELGMLFGRVGAVRSRGDFPKFQNTFARMIGKSGSLQSIFPRISMSAGVEQLLLPAPSSLT